MRSLRSDVRGDSEVIGFAFIFAMAILSVLVVLVSGQAGLADARDAERVNNAAQALDVLADNVDDLAYHGAPSRSTQVTLDDATLEFGEPVTVEVVVEGVDTYTYQLQSVVYDADTGTELVYVNGAVIREDRGGTVMLREPDLLLTSDETAITLVRLTPVEDAQGVGGSTTVNVRTTRVETDLVVAETGQHDVTYRVTSPHADVWKDYLDGAVGGCDLPVGSDTVSCTVSNVDRVYVTVVDVDVRLD